MKCFLKKAICCIFLAGVLAQFPKDIYAEETGNIGEVTEADTGQDLSDDTQQTGDAQQSDNTQQQGDVQQSNDIKQPDDTQVLGKSQPKKLMRPADVKGLHTTKQGKTKVRLEWKKSKHASVYYVYRKLKGKSYKNIAETKKCKYTDKEVSDGKSYSYKVVAANKQKRAKRAATITFLNEKVVQIRSQKYTYNQMKMDMKRLEKMYSDYCVLNKIGKSVQGRDIYDFAIGNSDAKKSLLVISTLHAREYICAAVMMKEIEYYLENYSHKVGGVSMANTLDKIQIHYVVMANPDGVTISQTKYSAWKANGRGVDLNRNFPAKKFVVGGKAGAQRYSGPKALSEPESRAIAELTKKLKKEQQLQGVINYHAMGRIIYGDCKSSKLSKAINAMHHIAKKNTGYKAALDDPSIPTWGGQYREYVMYMLGLPSITIEIGTSAAPCPYWQYETEFQKNKYIVIQIANMLLNTSL